ncbi:MAG: hypothetical protein KF911_04205 [Pseudomonadales bacterium]|nr:hypothetical protein [Pseudomonadales bacterium]
MTIKVIGAGFGRTGTLSLKLALERLGFGKCYHMMELFGHPDHVGRWRQAGRGERVDWDVLYAGYQSTVDWPSCNFYAEHMRHYPDAKVILSERDPERWYESVMNTIYPSSRAVRESGDPAMQPWADMAWELIWDGLFGGRMDDKAHVIEVYRRHNQRVREVVPAERLLVFEAIEGWAPLCAFLGSPVPDEPYPKVNTTEEFHNRPPRR